MPDLEEIVRRIVYNANMIYQVTYNVKHQTCSDIASLAVGILRIGVNAHGNLESVYKMCELNTQIIVIASVPTPEIQLILDNVLGLCSNITAECDKLN